MAHKRRGRARIPESLRAAAGELAMRLIHTCQLCGANSFEYLTERQRHTRELAANPAQWMPWNYPETLAHAPPPYRLNLSECLSNGLPVKRNQETLSASDADDRKCSAPGGPARAIFAEFEMEIPHERTKAWLGPCTSERNVTGAVGLQAERKTRRILKRARSLGNAASQSGIV